MVMAAILTIGNPIMVVIHIMVMAVIMAADIMGVIEAVMVASEVDITISCLVSVQSVCCIFITTFKFIRNITMKKFLFIGVALMLNACVAPNNGYGYGGNTAPAYNNNRNYPQSGYNNSGHHEDHDRGNGNYNNNGNNNGGRNRKHDRD
jgi:hypothetical protein